MSRVRKQLEENLAEVHDAISSACRRAGRAVDSVELIAVTKYAEWPWVETLLELGVENLGESRPQQLIERHGLLKGGRVPRWHLIGHLQRNKVRPILPLVSRIHSADSLKLLDRIDRIAKEQGLRPRVLLEVNLSREAAKDGFSPEELESEWDAINDRTDLQITGLMTMAPHTQDETIVRGVFRELKELRDRLVPRSGPNVNLAELSMGMSGDFGIAIEEGATHIRVGSRLFKGCREAVS